MRGGGSDIPEVLDVCCGSRMFYFDREDERVLFLDKRRERHRLRDCSSKGGFRTLIVEPDLRADFTALPFRGNRFSLVVFDPPHLVGSGKSGWLAKKYGKLPKDWRGVLARGFEECFRVLRANGVLVFKWNEHEVPVSVVVGLSKVRPLFGNRCGRTSKSHWLVFMKP